MLVAIAPARETRLTDVAPVTLTSHARDVIASIEFVRGDAALWAALRSWNFVVTAGIFKLMPLCALSAQHVRAVRALE